MASIFAPWIWLSGSLSMIGAQGFLDLSRKNAPIRFITSSFCREIAFSLSTDRVVKTLLEVVTTQKGFSVDSDWRKPTVMSKYGSASMRTRLEPIYGQMSLGSSEDACLYMSGSLVLLTTRCLFLTKWRHHLVARANIHASQRTLFMNLSDDT